MEKYICIVVLCICLVSCGGDPTGVGSSGDVSFVKGGGKLRIVYNPYKNVNWSTTGRYLAQTHDHTWDQRILDYCKAGYDVIPYGSYSGNPDEAHAWSELRWPAENWLLPSTIAAVRGKLLYPSPEHSYRNHVTSMFLYTYIEGWYPARGTPKESHHYETLQEKIDRIVGFGGLAIQAHPTVVPPDGVVAQEVYNALYRILADSVFVGDYNERYFLPIWDATLSAGRLIWGVGVNDHFGPGTQKPNTPDIDSGKTIVLASILSEQEVRKAFVEGRLFGVRDLGATKGLYPRIDAVEVSGNVITIRTADAVRWISMGAVVATGNKFNVARLPGSARYVRAEVGNAEGSVVYVQPFGLEP